MFAAQPSSPATPAIAAEATRVGVGAGVGTASDGEGAAMKSPLHTEEDSDEEDDGRPGSERTRRWLRGFKAEDIVRDKTLLRQQLEVGGGSMVMLVR